MSIRSSIERLLNDEGDFALHFDRVLSAGEAALPALAEVARRGRGIPKLTAVLSALPLEDPVGALLPWLEIRDPLSKERSMALQALGARGEHGVVKTLIDALPTDEVAAPEALGNLGCPEAVDALLAHVRTYLGNNTVIERSLLQDEDYCLEFRLALIGITALAKLGSNQLAAVPIQLATLRDEAESSRACLVRVQAVDCLRYVTAPGVAQALRSASTDRDEDTARAALRGMLFLGRKTEAEAWLEAVERGGPTAENALWCLERWAGQSWSRACNHRALAGEVRRWWRNSSHKFIEGVVYHGGAPVDLARLVRQLPEDPYDLRLDLKVRTGATPVLELLMGEPVPMSERVAVEAWWEGNVARFPAGKLHRWGRTFEPNAVG